MREIYCISFFFKFLDIPFPSTYISTQNIKQNRIIRISD